LSVYGSFNAGAYVQDGPRRVPRRPFERSLVLPPVHALSLAVPLLFLPVRRPILLPLSLHGSLLHCPPSRSAQCCRPRRSLFFNPMSPIYFSQVPHCALPFARAHPAPPQPHVHVRIPTLRNPGSSPGTATPCPACAGSGAGATHISPQAYTGVSARSGAPHGALVYTRHTPPVPPRPFCTPRRDPLLATP
jgi:hypothetical protein